MPKLRCSANNCLYNQSKYCSRNRIHIQGVEAIVEEETQCGTFKPCDDEKRNIYNSEFATMNEENEHLSINCDCEKCVYNKRDLCIKENVKISGMNAKNRGETVCESFAKKISWDKEK